MAKKDDVKEPMRVVLEAPEIVQSLYGIRNAIQAHREMTAEQVREEAQCFDSVHARRSIDKEPEPERAPYPWEVEEARAKHRQGDPKPWTEVSFGAGASQTLGFARDPEVDWMADLLRLADQMPEAARAAAVALLFLQADEHVRGFVELFFHQPLMGEAARARVSHYVAARLEVRTSR